MPHRVIILAVDCCFDSCSVAVFDGTSIVASGFELMQRGQAERLAPMAAEVLEAAGENATIGRVAVTTGPGTFTGVRIGLSFARAFALARGVPCLGVNSLAAVALAAGLEGVRVGVHPAPHGVYLEVYQDGVSLGAPGLFSLDDALARLPSGDVYLAGGGASLLADRLGPRAKIQGRTLPDAQDVARLAYGLANPFHPPSPLYLRAPDVRPPKGLRQAIEPAQ